MGCPQGKPVSVTLPECCGTAYSQEGRSSSPQCAPVNSPASSQCVPFEANVGLVLVLCWQPTGTGPSLSLQHRRAAWRWVQHCHNTRLFTSCFQLFQPQKAMLEMHSFMLVLGVFHNLEIWLSLCLPSRCPALAGAGAAKGCSAPGSAPASWRQPWPEHQNLPQPGQRMHLQKHLQHIDTLLACPAAPGCRKVRCRPQTEKRASEREGPAVPCSHHS